MISGSFKKACALLIAVLMTAALAVSAFSVTACSTDSADSISALQQLPVPGNVRVQGKTLYWDAVENATSYTVRYDGEVYSTKECSYDLSSLTAAGEHSVEVIACGDGKSYGDSASAVCPYITVDTSDYDKKLEELKEQMSGYDEQGFFYTLLDDATGYEVSGGTADLRGTVTIPNSVTEICASAFGSCTSLKSVTFADTSGWSAVLKDKCKTFSGAELAVGAAAAKYLTDTYETYTWTKK